MTSPSAPRQDPSAKKGCCKRPQRTAAVTRTGLWDLDRHLRDVGVLPCPRHYSPTSTPRRVRDARGRPVRAGPLRWLEGGPPLLLRPGGVVRWRAGYEHTILE